MTPLCSTKIGLPRAWRDVLALTGGTDGDVGCQRAGDARAAADAQRLDRARWVEQAIDRGHAHLRLLAHRRHRQLPVPLQRRHQLRQERREPLATQPIGRLTDLPKRRHLHRP